ncbi:TPA: hypothetical protein DIC38_03075 [Candidatus Nomurabacteria bacterium]|nr:MAG: hypothetical protein O210_OD1C00001G0168 [Parcubacteria bacterium RAAC4_OD1_1]HCY26635.1 hypothetical protein [Candidatus Nomurabacteria bacterium]
MENKKTTPIIIGIIVIVLVLIILIIVKNPNKNKEIIPNETEIELNEAMKNDTTKIINENLNQIDITDTTDEDLKSIDEELNNL